MSGRDALRVAASTAISVALLMVLVAACGSTPPPIAPASPPQPHANPSLMEPCRHARSMPTHWAIATFEHGGEQCGCWDQRMSCMRTKVPLCFAYGQWLWPLAEGPGGCCFDGQWRRDRCTEIGEPPALCIIPRVTFPLGNATSPDPKWLHDVALEQRQAPLVLVNVVAVENPREGTSSRELALARALVVRDAITASGVPPSGVFIDEPALGEAAPVGLVFLSPLSEVRFKLRSPTEVLDSPATRRPSLTPVVRWLQQHPALSVRLVAMLNQYEGRVTEPLAKDRLTSIQRSLLERGISRNRIVGFDVAVDRTALRCAGSLSRVHVLPVGYPVPDSKD